MPEFQFDFQHIQLPLALKNWVGNEILKKCVTIFF